MPSLKFQFLCALQNMADEFDRLVELNERGRCIKCKRREDEMITCERCREFKYCSAICLEEDRIAHMMYCNLIGLKKGILKTLTEEEAQRDKKVMEKAKLLSNDGGIKITERTLNEGLEKNGSGCDQGQDGSWKPKIRNKNKRKNKHNNGKNGGQNKNGSGTKNECDNGKKNNQKPAESLIVGGRFSGVAKVSSEEESGKNFGASWWKGSLKPKTAQTKWSSEAGRLETTKTNMKFKDFYSDSEDDETGKKNDLKETSQRDKSPVSGPAFKSASDKPSEAAQSDMELVKYDPKKAGEEMKRNSTNQDGSVRGKCLNCKKEGIMLQCSRCKIAKYCNKGCQKSHFKQHKDICKLKARFETAIQKVPQLLIVTLHLMNGPSEISVSLDNILPPIAALWCIFRRNIAIMVEIIAAHPHPFLYGAIVRDLSGRVTQVLFNAETEIYNHTVSNLWCPIIRLHLSECIRPGNFILLLKPDWSLFIDGKTGICVDDLEDVHFVFMDDD